MESKPEFLKARNLSFPFPYPRLWLHLLHILMALVAGFKRYPGNLQMPRAVVGTMAGAVSGSWPYLML